MKCGFSDLNVVEYFIIKISFEKRTSMKKRVKFLCGVLSALVLFPGVALPLGNTTALNQVYAADADYEYDEVVEELPTGDLESAKAYHFSKSALRKSVDSGYQASHIPATIYGASYTYKWQNYGSDYYYGKLSSKEKKLYQALQTASMKYLNKKTNCIADYDSNYGYYYYIDPVATNLSESAAIRVMNIFSYSNPQFYFYDHAYVTGTQDGDLYCALTVYPKFASGSSRMSATKAVSKKLTSWVKTVKKQSSLIKKIAKAQELICKKVTYHTSTYDQSAYSVFCGSKTVCAGYSSAFTVLCQASGIDTLILTSNIKNYEHEWNMVKIHGNWYNMDVTWDDVDKLYDINGDGTPEDLYYEYMLRNDKNFIYDYSYRYSGDTKSKISHTAESIWKKYGVPSAKIDTSPSESKYYLSYGSIKTLAKPTSLKLKKASKGVTVSWKKVSGAKYYIVERKVSGGSWKVVAKKCTKLTYTDKSAKKGKTYYYRVTAMKTSKTTKNYCSAKKIKR